MSTISRTTEIDDLFTEYRSTGCVGLRNRLVEAHLPIAERCARRYANRGEPLADLLQVARLGLVRAVERFDPERGVAFEAFALPTVLGELRRHFRDNCWIVSVPRRFKDLRSQLFRASDRMSQHLGRQPTAAEIGEVLDVEPEVIAAAIDTNRHYRAASWEALADPEHRTVSGIGRPSGVEDPERAGDRVDVACVLDHLDERTRRIVVWRFYEGCTQREIGARLGIGQVQVSRLLKRAIAVLRSELESDGRGTGDRGGDAALASASPS